MGPDGFGPSGDGGFGGGAGGAVPAGGHALPVRSAGSPEGALVFGGEGERPGFELGAFDSDEADEAADDDIDDIDDIDDTGDTGEVEEPADPGDPAETGGDQPEPVPALVVGTGLAGSIVTPPRSLFGPQSVVEAVQVLAEHPEAVILAGGTAAMPEITGGRRHPGTVLTLHRCAELRGWSSGAGEVLLHAGLTLAEMSQRELREQVPALNQAARTIGAPHIREAATLGGNLVVGPASADLPVVLAALGASVLVASADGVRTVSVSDFYDRDGRPQLTPGELVVGARVPVVEGMQGFMKIGVRGGISRAILSIMLAVDPARRSATCVVGAMALAGLPSGAGRGGLPTLLRADHADRWLAEQVDWEAGAIADPTVYETFGRLVADSLVYGDGGGTLGGGGDPYRRKAVEICARRALLRALPPLGWLDQVRELQKRADFQRAKQRVERAEQARNQER